MGDQDFRSHRCPNRARFGRFCGIHDPEKAAKRRADRGPTQFEREIAARNVERRRVKGLEERAEKAEAQAAGLTHELEQCAQELNTLKCWAEDATARIEELRAAADLRLELGTAVDQETLAGIVLEVIARASPTAPVSVARTNAAADWLRTAILYEGEGSNGK